MNHVASSIVPIKFQLSNNMCCYKVHFINFINGVKFLKATLCQKKLQGNKYNHLVL
jgi:hypothetical protein